MQIVVLTVATRDECHLCVRLHTAPLRKLGATPELVTALTEQRPLPEERLEAVRQFTRANRLTRAA